MVTSDLSSRINDVLRYVGITRNMNAYMILSQALTLIAEDEDRLRAVEKEMYTPMPTLQQVHSDRINGGFPLLPPHLLFFANTLISRKLDIKAFTKKSLSQTFISIILRLFLYLFYIYRVQF